jgi:hypothetical protein
MNPIKELDCVALTRDVPEHNLRRGDVGTAVLVHRGGEGYELEFVAYDGQTIALFTAPAAWVRALRTGDIPHVRELAA